MFYVLVALIGISIFMSLRTLFLPYNMKGKFISLENFLYLGFIYITILLGFGLLYLLFSVHGNPLLIEVGAARNQNAFENSFYFSAMTLFSVGNGDIVPQGFGRVIAMIEALIGYTLPAAFVAHAVIDRDS